jgi:hypothetical protein
LGVLLLFTTMSRRFSRIRESSRLSGAVDNYINWLTTAATRPRNIGGGNDRGPTVEILIQPFGFDMPTGTFARATCTQEARTQMGTAIGAHGILPSGGSSLQRIPGFKAARATLFVGTGSSTVATSNITGLQYLKYAGASYSHPFGRSADADVEFDTFGTIRTVLAGANRRISYSAELRKQL